MPSYKKKSKSKVKSTDLVTTQKQRFSCFVCMDHNIDLNHYEMYIHDSLNIAMCDSCYVPHTTSGEWHMGKDWEDRDPNGKTIFCEVCAEGGTLLPCDDCEKSYCTDKCLKNFMTESTLQDILDDDSTEFKCFVCVKNESDEVIGKTSPIYLKYLNATKRYKKDQEQIRSEQENDELAVRSTTKTFKCFSCFEPQKMTKNSMPKRHQIFDTAICNGCHDYLLSEQENWTYTDGKSDYCVVTGDDCEEDDDDELYVCDMDDCKNAFIKKTLLKWMGVDAFEE